MRYRWALRALIGALMNEADIRNIIGGKRQHYYSISFQAVKAYAESTGRGQNPYPAVRSVVIRNLASLVRERPLTRGELDAAGRAARNITNTLRRMGEIQLKNLAIHLRLCYLKLKTRDYQRFGNLGIWTCP